MSEFLDDQNLRHIKTGLIDNLITFLLKVIIKEIEPDLVGNEETIIMCLVAVLRRHPQRFAQRMRQELPRLNDGSNDDELRRVMRLFRADRRCWNWLGISNRVRTTKIVSNYSFEAASLDAVASCLEIVELRPSFSARAKRSLWSKNTLCIRVTQIRYSSMTQSSWSAPQNLVHML